MMDVIISNTVFNILKISVLHNCPVLFVKTHLIFQANSKQHKLRHKTFSFKKALWYLTINKWQIGDHIVNHFFLFYTVSLLIKFYSNKTPQHLQTQRSFFLHSGKLFTPHNQPCTCPRERFGGKGNREQIIFNSY